MPVAQDLPRPNQCQCSQHAALPWSGRRILMPRDALQSRAPASLGEGRRVRPRQRNDVVARDVLVFPNSCFRARRRTNWGRGEEARARSELHTCDVGSARISTDNFSALGSAQKKF